MTEEKTGVSTQITQEQKDRWIESKGKLSMSQFIRTAVEKFINEEESGDSTEVSKELDSKIETLLDRSDSIQADLDTLSSQSQAIYQEVRKPPEGTNELAHEIFGILPTERQLFRSDQKSLIDKGSDDPIFYDGYIRTGRAADIGDHLNEDTVRVRNALDILKEDHQVVESAEIEGNRRYYKDV